MTDTPRVTPRITCSGCDTTWTGATRCHCSAEGCHRTFAGLGLFDRHRHNRGEHGGCDDPANIRTQAGERVMFLRDGIWSGPEMTEEQILARFGERLSV